MLVHASFGCDKVSNCLSVLASNDGMVKHEVIECLVRVLEIELNHFNTIGECIKRHFSTFGDSDEFLLILINSMARVQSQRTQVLFQGFLVFEVSGAQATDLRIEKLSCIEHGLLFLSRHLIEQVGVIWVLNQVDAAIGMFIGSHVL